jgi:hypothetical protein
MLRAYIIRSKLHYMNLFFQTLRNYSVACTRETITQLKKNRHAANPTTELATYNNTTTSTIRDNTSKV